MAIIDPRPVVILHVILYINYYFFSPG